MMSFQLTGACLSVEGSTEEPGVQSRESRPAGPNLVQLLSSKKRMMSWRDSDEEEGGIQTQNKNDEQDKN